MKQKDLCIHIYIYMRIGPFCFIYNINNGSLALMRRRCTDCRFLVCLVLLPEKSPGLTPALQGVLGIVPMVQQYCYFLSNINHASAFRKYWERTQRASFLLLLLYLDQSGERVNKLTIPHQSLSLRASPLLLSSKVPLKLFSVPYFHGLLNVASLNSVA